jgi:hypothetical protein
MIALEITQGIALFCHDASHLHSSSTGQIETLSKHNPPRNPESFPGCTWGYSLFIVTQLQLKHHLGARLLQLGARSGARTVPASRTSTLLHLVMMRFGHITKRTFFSLRAKPIRFPPTDPAFAVPSQTLVDEETWTGYTPETYYPAKPGEVLAGQFQLMTKIGWGTGSTVWLAQDISRYGISVLVMPRANKGHMDI